LSSRQDNAWASPPWLREVVTRKRPLSWHKQFARLAQVVDYRKRAEKCRERAARGGKMEDWAHFLEMAQTWEKLADLHDLTQRLKSSGALLTKPATRAE